MVATVPYAVEKAVEKSASTTDETASTSPSRLDERAAEALHLYNPLQPSTTIQLYILYTLQPSTTPLSGNTVSDAREVARDFPLTTLKANFAKLPYR